MAQRRDEWRRAAHRPVFGEISGAHQAAIMALPAPPPQLAALRGTLREMTIMFSGFQDFPAAVPGGNRTISHSPAPPLADGGMDEIWAQRGNDYVRLRAGEIERVESERDYVHIHNGERAYLLRATLKAVHARLGEAQYLRVRRSAIVRIDRIAAIRDRGYGNIQVVLRSGATMQVGRTYLKPVRERLRRWRGQADLSARGGQ